MNTSTCLLLWWWYDDDVACATFNFLQNSLNISKIKLSPASDIIFLGTPHSEKLLYMLDYWNFGMIVYKTKVFFI